MTSRTPATTSPTLRRRQLLAVAAGLLVALAGWWGLTRPVALRPVARIDLSTETILLHNGPPDPAFWGHPHCLYLRIVRHNPDPIVPATLVCLDWTLRERWRITDVIPDVVATGDEYGLAVTTLFSRGVPVAGISPDGRTFALLRPTARGLFITSWRDGRRLGTARVGHYPMGAVECQLQPTDSGRVWLYYSEAPLPYRLWAIDGTQVAVGDYTPTRTSHLANCRIAPDGSALLCHGDYVTLQVRGARVLTRRRCRGSLTMTWIDTRHALTWDGRCYDASGLVERAPQWRLHGLNWSWRPCRTQIDLPSTHNGDFRTWRWRVYLPPPAHAWDISTRRSIIEAVNTPDGRAVVTEEGTFRRTVPIPDRVWDYLDARQRGTSLAVYTAPGRCRARFRVPVGSPSVSALGISADGHRVAVRSDSQIMLYAW